MPRLEPIPLDKLAPKTRQIIEDGVADGTYATPIPLQIFAYRTQQILMTHAARQVDTAVVIDSEATRDE